MLIFNMLNFSRKIKKHFHEEGKESDQNWIIADSWREGSQDLRFFQTS